MQTIVFIKGTADPETLERELAEVIEALSAEDRRALDTSLRDISANDVTVRSGEEAGFTGAEIVVGIAIAVGAHIVNKFWDDVIWPKLKEQIGGDGVKEQIRNAEDPTK